MDSPQLKDIVVVGSSPAMLLIALKLTVDYGRSVIVLESKAELGGAWAPQCRFETTIDNGPHLLYNFNTDVQPLVKKIEGLTGIEFQEMMPAPASSSWLGSRFMEYSFGFENSAKWLKVVRMLYVVAQRKFGFTGPRYYEPKAGLSSLVSGLSKALVSAGVCVRPSSVVKAICEKGSQAEVILESGQVFLANAVFATAKAIGRVTCEGDAEFQLPRPIAFEYDQCYMVVRNTGGRFTYFRAFSDPLFFLAADLTRTAEPSVSNEGRILCVNLKKGVDRARISDDVILGFLRNNNLVDDSAIVDRFEWEHLQVEDYSLQSVEYLNEKLRRVRIIHCHNKMKTLHQILATNFLEESLRKL
jgi:hypothetical protein